LNNGPFWPQAAVKRLQASKAGRAKPRAKPDVVPKIADRTVIRTILMTDTEYLDRAEALLGAVEQACDRLNETTDADLDNQRVGGMITLTFANRSQIIINLQKPLQEVWLAARAGGFHYRHDGQAWMDTKGQGEFFACLSRFASEQAGQPLNFNP
jgi:CyaY protein